MSRAAHVLACRLPRRLLLPAAVLVALIVPSGTLALLGLVAGLAVLDEWQARRGCLPSVAATG